MKTLNNKILFIVLIVLVAAYGLSRIFRSSARESNARRELLAIDTSSVSEIRVYPNAEKNKEIRLVRNGQQWNVQMDGKTADADQGLVRSSLSYFIHLKPLQFISKKKDKWKEYHVGDTSTQVKFLKGGDVLADIRIGKIGFNMKPGQQQFSPGSVFTYVRLSDEQEVYTVEGFLESSFNHAYADWRDKTFLRLSSAGVTKINFRYPADSGFVLMKKGKTWRLNDQEVDSTKVKNYLSPLESKNAMAFADEFTPGGDASAVVSVENGSGTIAIVQAWKESTGWVFASSHRKGIYFASKGLENILEPKKAFLPAKRK